MEIPKKKLSILFTVIIVILITTSCTNNRRPPKDNNTVSADTTNSVVTVPLGKIPPTLTNPTIKIFIENSGSMNGFINQKSEFESAIQNMVVLLKYHYGESNIELNYINSDIINVPSNVNVVNFASKMLQPSMFKNTGKVGSTNLNDIFKMVLESTDNSSISIMISDCIYSIDQTGTTETQLNNQKNKTLDAFLSKARGGKQSFLATTIVQLESNFNGSYWDYKHPKGAASQQLDCLRPYYMTIIGQDKLIHDFNSKFNFEEMSGYKNRYTMSTADTSHPFYKVLPISYKKGKFKLDKSKENIINAKHHNKDFAFALAINLDNIPVLEEEKTNLNNYIITDNYIIEEIIPIEKAFLKPISKSIIGDSASHIIKFYLKNDKAIKNLNVSFRNKVPEWIYDSSSTDDTKIDSDPKEQNKTFGFKYLVEGINDAYKQLINDSEFFFTININIK